MVSASVLEFFCCCRIRSWRNSYSAFWQIFSWAAVNCSSGLTELWPVLETNWTRVLAANSFKTISDLRFFEGLVSREAIPFLIWLKSSVFRRLRAACEKGISSYESQRLQFPKDLIGESGDVPTHVFLFVPPPQREKRVLLKERHRACYERTQLKRDSSQTNGISNSAYSKAATHKRLLTKHKPKWDSHQEIMLRNTS